MQTVDYATDKTKNQGLQNSLSIIQKLLSSESVKYPIQSIQKKQEYGTNIQFISYKNMRILDILTYCLSVSVHNRQVPIHFFVHNMLQNKMYLINQKSTYPYLIKAFNRLLTIYSIDNENTFNGSYVDDNIQRRIMNFSSQQTYGGILNISNMYQQKFYNYSHDKRQWSVDGYTQDIIRKIVDYTDQSMINLLPTKNTLQGFNYSYSYPNYMNGIQYENFKKLFLTNNIGFTIFGNLQRAAGQFITINTQSPGFKKQFGNTWQIYRCVHIWKDKRYFNEVVAVRAYRKGQNKQKVDQVKK